MTPSGIEPATFRLVAQPTALQVSVRFPSTSDFREATAKESALLWLCWAITNDAAVLLKRLSRRPGRAVPWLRRLVAGLAVPWLRRLVAGLPPRRPGFDPRPVHVGFVVDKVLRFSPFHRCSITRKKTNHLHHRVAQ